MPMGRVAQVAGLVAVIAAWLATAPATANDLPRRVALSAADVRLVLQQAVLEAQARSAPATMAVVDRVGNVLAVYRMSGARLEIRVDAGRDVQAPRGLALPAPIEVALRLSNRGSVFAGVIAKAITGAYLSSGGNAFSTRTASQIIQENFNPGAQGLEGGPLFGVQLSQLPCSDLSVRFRSPSGGVRSATIGPKRSPLGFSGDPGGFPLYKDGTLVGGVGVISDRVYGIARDQDDSGGNDEAIARAATFRFGAPESIRANRVAVDGRLLTYSDGGGINEDRLRDADSVNLAAFGTFPPVRGYYDGGRTIAGQAFGFGRSGIRPDRSGRFRSNRAFILANAGGANRFPPIRGGGRAALSAREVTEILASALGVALDARAQIRQPLNSHVEVTISVVDTASTILGIVRTPDAPVFGTDVSLQKARSAMFFSSNQVAGTLAAIGFNENGTLLSSYVSQTRSFFDRNVTNGSVAFAARSIGNIARPFYPDGQNGSKNGPLSVPFARWSPFNTGLQTDLIFGNILHHLGFVLREFDSDTAPWCRPLLQNGLQIFAGGVPIYRGDVLVGGVGVSGDGIDQDDMVAFLGLDRAKGRLGTGVGNAPRSRRADRLSPDGANLRYVQCPFAPFLGQNDQNVCAGL